MKPQHSASLMEGLRHTAEMVVKETDLDVYWGIGNRRVLAVPILINFIEQTTNELINPYLAVNFETIAIELNLKHMGQAVQGDLIRCNIHLKFIEDDNLFFDISVIDTEHEEVAHGAHERLIIPIQ
jgi:fluoroacetyl-CoA thioesterase